MSFGRQIEEREEDGLLSLHYRVIAEGARDMGLAHPRGSDEDEIARLLEPVGLHELHDLLPGYLRVEGPVEVGKKLHPFDPRHPEEVLPSLLFSQPILLGEEPHEERPVLPWCSPQDRITT